jgi:A/G-specific adenine glycosylase
LRLVKLFAVFWRIVIFTKTAFAFKTSVTVPKKMTNKLVDSSSLIDIEEVANRFRKSDGSALVPSVDVLTVAGLRTKLLSWYRENRRMLPWRGDEVDGILAPAVSAYGIWVSEIMLQQTRVETVIPYWRRWMERFPTIEVLARATPDEVNALWAGLGYYRRAQQLLKGAQSVVSTFKGKIPDTAEDLKKIPGIGPYTAGAISSIAFGKTEPLVDGNVIRVLSRLFALQVWYQEVGFWVSCTTCILHDDADADEQALYSMNVRCCSSNLFFHCFELISGMTQPLTLLLYIYTGILYRMYLALRRWTSSAGRWQGRWLTPLPLETSIKR